MKSIAISAPGKLMILGEHAVVYGYPCLASCVNKYLSVCVKNLESASDEIFTPAASDQNFVKGAIQCFKEKFSVKRSVFLSTKSELGNFGLGSSAAVTVAAMKALAALFQVKLNDKELFDLSYKVVLEIQGKASGFDIAASISGGTIYFDGNTKETELLSFEKLPLVVAFTGKKGSTRKMINKVYLLKKNKPKLVDRLFKEITQLVEAGKESIKKKDWYKLGLLMDKNQILLRQLQVTTPETEKLITAAKDAGAFGVKLSGAGGGDCIIAAISQEKRENIKKAIFQTGGKIVEIEVGTGKGVKLL